MISNGLLFLEADHYESPEVVSRMHFLTDRASALAYTGTDVFDKGMYVLRKWFPLRAHVSSYREFLASNKRFLVVGSYDYVLEWLPRKLVAERAQLNFIGQYTASYGDVLVLEVSLP